MNGWYFSARQGTNQIPVAEDAALFGATTSQFSELSELWSTYRVNWVELTYFPSVFGAGANGPVVTALDPAGSIGPIDAAATDIQIAFSRLRSVDIKPACRPAHMRINFSNWLVQTVAEPYLPMVLDNGDRGVYA